ncbi:methyltransferase family protein [Teredinibacter turnerae]|nr:isoprenylcysteine carboxylmethyltransferase family protein [Teredinibacter turnerae]
MQLSEYLPQLVDFNRVYLACFFTFVAAFYTLRILIQKKRTGREYVFAGTRFCANWWNHMVFRFFRVVIWLACVFRLIFPGLDSYLGLFPSLNQSAALLLGDIMLTVGFAWVLVVHFRMGHHWASGVKPGGPEALITDGFYAFSRNPMYLGVALAQVGFFLALPSVFSLLCLAVGLTALYSQVRVEESHLAALFSSRYDTYRAQVRRWV